MRCSRAQRAEARRFCEIEAGESTTSGAGGRWRRSHRAVPPSTSSLSSGRVLHCPYGFERGRLIARELTELLALPDRKLVRVLESLQQGRHPMVTVAYFRRTRTRRRVQAAFGKGKKIDLFERIIVFMGENGRSGGEAISIDDVVDTRSK